MNLLVVEDDPVDQENFRRALVRTSACCRVVQANDGLHALQLLRDGSVPTERRLVLLDICMPRMSGLEFLHVLRADPQLSQTPVVVLTTSDAEADRREAYALHVAGYLIKPLRFDEFVELVSGLMHYWTHAVV